jgi:hypothetical protein
MNRSFGGMYRLNLQARKIREPGTSMSRWLQTEPPAENTQHILKFCMGFRLEQILVGNTSITELFRNTSVTPWLQRGVNIYRVNSIIGHPRLACQGQHLSLRSCAFGVFIIQFP